MSEEQLKAFIAKVQADTSLQEQLKAEGADVVAIAKAVGFLITTEEINSYRSSELSDEELEGVAGGGRFSGAENPVCKSQLPTNPAKSVCACVG